MLWYATPNARRRAPICAAASCPGLLPLLRPWSSSSHVATRLPDLTSSANTDGWSLVPSRDQLSVTCPTLNADSASSVSTMRSPLPTPYRAVSPCFGTSGAIHFGARLCERACQNTVRSPCVIGSTTRPNVGHQYKPSFPIITSESPCLKNQTFSSRGHSRVSYTRGSGRSREDRAAESATFSCWIRSSLS